MTDTFEDLEARWQELLGRLASDMPPEMASMAATILKMLKEEADAGRPLVNRFNFTKAEHLAHKIQLTDWALDMMLKQGVIVSRGDEYDPDIGLRAEVEFAEGKGRGIH
jgi:hypothetical protein